MPFEGVSQVRRTRPAFPDLVPSEATIMRFIAHRAILNIHNIDWMNPVLHAPIPVSQLGQGGIFVLFDQNDTLSACLATPGPEGGPQVLASGILMASGLETRDQNYDPCLAYVVVLDD